MSVALLRATWAYVSAHPELSATERLLLLFVADAGQDRRHLERGRWVEAWQSFHPSSRIAEAVGVGDAGLRAARTKLSKHPDALEVRVPIGTGRDGRPLFAKPGTAMTYTVPAVIGATTVAPRCDDGSALAPQGATDVAHRRDDGSGYPRQKSHPNQNQPPENSESPSTSNPNQVPAPVTSAHGDVDVDPWEEQLTPSTGPGRGLDEEEVAQESSGSAADVPSDIAALLTTKGYPEWLHADTWADAMSEEWHDPSRARALVQSLPQQDPNLPPF